MNNMWKALTLAIFILFLAGCTTTATTSNKAFIGGTEGLRLSFFDSTPPDAIFDNGSTPFIISIKAENVGESNIGPNEGYVTIQGLDPQAVGWPNEFTQQFPTDGLQGAQRNFDGSVLNGGVASIDFNDLAYQPAIQGNIQQSIWADVCYPYSTRTTTLLCVKKSAAQTLGSKKICDVEGEKYPQNSGAPIQITSLKENFVGSNKIGISMVISHEGKGDAVFKDDAPFCDDLQTSTDKGKVKITIQPVRIAGMDVYPVCSGLSEKTGDNVGYIRLSDNGGRETFSLYCTIDTTGVSSVYQIPVDILMEYKYLQHIQKTITIRHAIQ